MSAAALTVSALGLSVTDATVLNDSNRLVVHLRPCDVVARVTAKANHLAAHGASAERELEVVARLAKAASPVAPLESRVPSRALLRDGFVVTMWAYVESVRRMVPRAEYAGALARLHADLRHIDVTTPHVIDRLAVTQRDVEDRGATPELAQADRALLATTLRDLGRSIARRTEREQLLHGEPHPWNVLNTRSGPLFIDFENAARGPVEYDLAWVPKAVSDLYFGADQALVSDCRGAVLAIIAMHRWRLDDQHPSGRQSGVAFLNALRDGPPWPALDEITW